MKGLEKQMTYFRKLVLAQAKKKTVREDTKKIYKWCDEYNIYYTWTNGSIIFETTDEDYVKGLEDLIVETKEEPKIKIDKRIMETYSASSCINVFDDPKKFLLELFNSRVDGYANLRGNYVKYRAIEDMCKVMPCRNSTINILYKTMPGYECSTISRLLVSNTTTDGKYMRYECIAYNSDYKKEYI